MRVRLSLLIIALIIAAGAWGIGTAAQSGRAGCGNTLPTRLIVRERARVSPIGDNSPLNVREAPGTDSEKIGSIPIGGVFYVLDGYECTTLYTWYQVAYQGITGWVAEGSASTYFTEPYPPAT